jgi:hypothetical protein
MSEGGTHPIPRVFISYAQHDPAHSARVLELAYALEADGLSVELDQFHGQELIDWPRWCAERLDPKNTDFVLMVCSAEYRRRIEGHMELDVGRGVFWEGDLIYGYLYRAKANERFIPLLLDDEPQSVVPPVVANWNTFRLRRFGVETGDPGYEDLYRLLTGQPATLRPSRGTLKRLPPRPVPSPPGAAPAVRPLDLADPSVVTGSEKSEDLRGDPAAGFTSAPGLGIAPEARPASPPEPVTARIRDLLLKLPGWTSARSRQTFIEVALGRRHRVLDEVEWEGDARQLAWDIAKTCEDYPEPTASGLSPLCALLAAIPLEFGRHPPRDEEIADLQRRLRCQPARRPRD